MKNNTFSRLSRLLIGLGVALTASLLFGYTFILNNSTDNGHVPTNLPIKWPAATVGSVATVPLQLKLGTTPTYSDGSNPNTCAQAAFQVWNAVIGSVQFTTTSTTQPAGTATDGKDGSGTRANELVFASTIYGKAFDTGTLAITTTWYSGNDRIESDTIFNTTYTWNSYRGNLQVSTLGYDLRRVAIHELGHSLGLDHPDEANQSVSAIMNSHASNIDTITTDDTTGAQKLYGPPAAPANDNFANAVAVTLSSNAASVTGYNTNATKESGEPAIGSGNTAGGRSAWWKWTASSSGSMVIDTRGSYFDTALAVFTGSSVSSLTSVASNDDIGQEGTVYTQASKVTVPAVAGTTYYIAVDGWDGDCAGITLNFAFTPVAGAPSITTQPTNVTVNAGSSASFSVVASGSGTLSYQWYFGSTAISGATSATYTISSAQSSNAGSYSVVVSNSSGSVTSNTATLTVNTAPSITSQPSSTTVTAGNSASFSVTATGTDPLSYQWSKGGTAISGATSSTYTISSPQTSDSGSSFTVTISNVAGSVTSSAATLTVNAVVSTPVSSGGGGGGGGAPSEWFLAALTVAGLARFIQRRLR